MSKSKKIKVFISYDYDKDNRSKNLMKAWSENSKINFEFKDCSTDISINSKNKDYIKQCILKGIKKSDVLVCIIGKETHKSKWVDYEIKQAHKLGKRVVGILTEKGNKCPEEFIKLSDSLCDTFKLSEIEDYIIGTRNYYSQSLGAGLKRVAC